MSSFVSKLAIYKTRLFHWSDLQNPIASTSQIRKQVQMYIPASSGAVPFTAALTTRMRPTYVVFTEDRMVINRTASIEPPASLFSHSVDNHNCTLLELVFSLDAVANFVTPASFVDGLATTEVFLQSVLTGTVNQHAFSASTISVASNQSTTASSSILSAGYALWPGKLDRAGAAHLRAVSFAGFGDQLTTGIADLD
ncbi:hypothetical protein BDR22DRAFT_876775 [Usnea florida]